MAAMSAEIIDLEQQRLYRQQLRAAALFVLLARLHSNAA
jgi:hypothetical protein